MTVNHTCVYDSHMVYSVSPNKNRYYCILLYGSHNGSVIYECFADNSECLSFSDRCKEMSLCDSVVQTPNLANLC